MPKCKKKKKNLTQRISACHGAMVKNSIFNKKMLIK